MSTLIQVRANGAERFLQYLPDNRKRNHFDLDRLSIEKRMTVESAYERFAGLDTVAFTWTCKQWLPASQGRRESMVLRPELALKTGTDRVHRLSRRLIRKDVIDRRRDLLCVEQERYGQVHLHGVIAVPRTWSPTRLIFALDKEWSKELWANVDGRYRIPATSTDAKRWISYMLKDDDDAGSIKGLWVM